MYECNLGEKDKEASIGVAMAGESGAEEVIHSSQ
jgi:hypothetical protein